jgi:hypothetical protein
MPRIRVRTPDGERIVGTANCSTLSIKLLAYAQRSSLQLQADARLLVGDDILERWAWEFPELDERARIELISEPGDTFDPADRSETKAEPTPLATQRQDSAEIAQIERELAGLQDALKRVRLLKARDRCAFCGRDKAEVNRLIAGPLVMICDDCITACNELLVK